MYRGIGFYLVYLFIYLGRVWDLYLDTYKEIYICIRVCIYIYLDLYVYGRYIFIGFLG